MKNLILCGIFSFSALSSFAQTAADNIEASSNLSATALKEVPVAASTNTTPKVIYVTNTLEAANLVTNKNFISFQNIEELYDVRAYVTNTDGDILVNQKVNSKPKIDVSKFPKGLYFVTLINERTNTRKSFTLKK